MSDLGKFFYVNLKVSTLMIAMKYLALFAILPIIVLVMTSSTADQVFALKSEGGNTPGRVGTKSYGSSNAGIICGGVLCSDYEGGYTKYLKDREQSDEQVIPDAPSPKSSISQSTSEESTVTEKDLGSVLRLSRANVPATIPMHMGYFNGESVYYIITDSSDPTHAEVITQNQGWKVELAPLLANTPKAALSTTYMFTNGVQGDGVHGFQGEVFTSTPAQAEIYSALTSHVHVTWNDGKTPRVLDSQEMITAAAKASEVTLAEVPVVLNMPQIVWPDGQMIVKDDKTLADDTPYGGGQVLDIDTDEMTVTFIAHRGWVQMVEPSTIS